MSVRAPPAIRPRASLCPVRVLDVFRRGDRGRWPPPGSSLSVVQCRVSRRRPASGGTGAAYQAQALAAVAAAKETPSGGERPWPRETWAASPGAAAASNHGRPVLGVAPALACWACSAPWRASAKAWFSSVPSLRCASHQDAVARVEAVVSEKGVLRRQRGVVQAWPRQRGATPAPSLRPRVEQPGVAPVL